MRRLADLTNPDRNDYWTVRNTDLPYEGLGDILRKRTTKEVNYSLKKVKKKKNKIK